MKCQKCFLENDENATFCSRCGMQLNSKYIKPEKGKGCAIALLGLLFIIIMTSIIINAGNTKTSSKTDTTQQQKAGIDPDVFHKTVIEKIKEIDTSNLIGKINTKIYGETGYVDLYLTDLSSWSYASDVEKKEFMNNFGNLMDSIASITAYSGTETIGISTRLYSPGGLELAERTIWGNVKLK